MVEYVNGDYHCCFSLILIAGKPLWAFEILLVHTGFKELHLVVFKRIHNQGIEQLVFFIITMVITLYTNLLVGLLGRFQHNRLVTHILLARIPVSQFFKLVCFFQNQLIPLPDSSYIFKVRGIANFLGIIKVDKLVAQFLRMPM